MTNIVRIFLKFTFEMPRTPGADYTLNVWTCLKDSRTFFFSINKDPQTRFANNIVNNIKILRNINIIDGRI
jgi:hypothetical protein